MSIRELIQKFGGVASQALRRVIIDTDWWTDCDDVGALRVATWGENDSAFDLIAIMNNAVNSNTVRSIDAYMGEDNREGIAIGADFQATDFGGSPPYQVNMVADYPYVGMYASTEAAEDAVRTYRRALKEAIDDGVKIDIISIGYLNNLSRLLDSVADDISSLTGTEIINQGVNQLWVMGGTYPSGTENNFSRNTRAKEAAYNVVTNWPIDGTIFLGYEVGSTVITDPDLTSDIVTDAYLDYDPAGTRSSWDPMMVYLAKVVTPSLFGMSLVQGTNVVTESTGANVFTAGTGPHYYVTKDEADSYYKDLIDDIFNKVTWPPSRASKGQQDIARVLFDESATDKSNLLAWYTTDDLTGVADYQRAYTDAEELEFWRDRSGNHNHLIPASASGPVVKTSIGGEVGVLFSGSERLKTENNFSFPETCTVYVTERHTATPGGNDSMVGMDSGASPNRVFHLKITGSSTLETVSFTGASGFVDSEPSVTTNTWNVMTGQRTTTVQQAFVNGTSNGSTAISAPSANSAIPLCIGAREYDATTESFVGYIKEVRIYEGVHNQTTINSIVSEMG